MAANLMFALPAAAISAKHRASAAHFLSEIIATLGLMLVIFALAGSGRSRSAPAAVGAYIGAAQWFTSSTSFANPAITVGRMFSDTFAGIAPSSLLVPALIAILGKWNWWLPRPARRLLQVPAPPPAQPASHAAAGTRR